MLYIRGANYICLNNCFDLIYFFYKTKSLITLYVLERGSEFHILGVGFYLCKAFLFGLLHSAKYPIMFLFCRDFGMVSQTTLIRQSRVYSLLLYNYRVSWGMHGKLLASTVSDVASVCSSRIPLQPSLSVNTARLVCGTRDLHVSRRGSAQLCASDYGGRQRRPRRPRRRQDSYTWKRR